MRSTLSWPRRSTSSTTSSGPRLTLILMSALLAPSCSSTTAGHTPVLPSSSALSTGAEPYGRDGTCPQSPDDLGLTPDGDFHGAPSQSHNFPTYFAGEYITNTQWQVTTESVDVIGAKFYRFPPYNFAASIWTEPREAVASPTTRFRRRRVATTWSGFSCREMRRALRKSSRWS